jgi:hypothetical protein
MRCAAIGRREVRRGHWVKQPPVSPGGGTLKIRNKNAQDDGKGSKRIRNAVIIVEGDKVRCLFSLCRCPLSHIHNRFLHMILVRNGPLLLALKEC